MPIGRKRTGVDIGEKIPRIERNLDNPVAALSQIGAMMVAASQRAFKEQSYDGDSWAPRAAVNVFGIIADFHAGKNPPARRLQRRPALRDTGRLASSIAFKVAGKTVEVGSSLEYAGKLFKGGPIESKPVTESVQALLADWLDRKPQDLKDKLGFLLSEKMTGQTLKSEVPARRFLGLTDELMRDVKETLGVKILEVE